MDANQAQEKLIQAIDVVVKSRLNNYQTTNSMIGVLTEDPVGFDCKVRINNEIIECSVPEHLHSWVQKDDIVIVQDLYNDGRKKLITGKTGQLQAHPSIVFEDPNKKKLISGRDGIFETSNDEKITYGAAIEERE
ncbi:hypothetical protein JXA27_06875 [Aerococcaceae bacterium zg-B36]|uniref:hypothetical protein n=1 Tax=Aerococcaceae bacterium zg-252 TaxID=2796928 RepID=UPI001BD8BE78|nr:hypothetical protein [Aerococcaceae bacterium zg-B36]